MAMKKDDPLLIQNSLKEAQFVVEDETLIRLSARDWCWLLEWMDVQTKPNSQLQAAMNRYKQACRGEVGTTFSW
jgi:uncharacterized protein (DUF1778 family)